MSRKQIWTQGEGTDNRYWIPVMTIGTISSLLKQLSRSIKIIKYFPMAQSSRKKITAMARRPGIIKCSTGIRHIWSCSESANMESKNARQKVAFRCMIITIPNIQNTSSRHINILPNVLTLSQSGLAFHIPGILFEHSCAGFYLWRDGEYHGNGLWRFLFKRYARHTRPGYFGVDVHELTHQWFGDLITIRNGPQMWLHESHATFFPKLFTREVYGEDAYEWNRRANIMH